MSDTMLFGVLKMPFEMAMNDEISRRQFYQRVQELVARVEAQPEQQAEPVISAWSLREVYFDEDGEPLMHRSPPAAQPKQEPVVSLPYHPCTRILIAGLKDLHAWNVLHEWDKERKIVDDGMVATTSPAAQRPWQGLTDEDRRKFAAAQYGWEDLLIATEAKLKERNT